MKLKNYKEIPTTTGMVNVEEPIYQYQPKTVDDFGNYVVSFFSSAKRKTTKKASMLAASASFMLVVLWLVCYKMDMLRFEFSHRPTTAHATTSLVEVTPSSKLKAAMVAPAMVAPAMVAPATVAPATVAPAPSAKDVIEVVPGFEGLDNVVDNTTGKTVKQQLRDNSVSHNLTPASVKELTPTDVKKYITTFSRIAVAEMDKFGILASITMAQGIIESHSGTSVLAVRHNNHFGIKCFSKSCAKGHCSNHTDDHHKDFFRIYADSHQSWRAHSEFLANQDRYKGLFKCGKNYKLWALKLREFGYATDPTYDKKLIGIIERYELYKLDDL